MGKYNSAIITTEGINMFASAIGGGDTVTFMTMQASSHAYPSTTDFMSLTSLQDVEATVNVNYAGVYNTNVVQVSARFDNDGVSTAYLINTLGLFAKLGSGEPKLVAVVTAVTPDQMPVYDANNPSAFIYNLQCTVQNAGSMAVSVNPAGTVTVEQFNEEMATKLGRTDNAVSATKIVTSRSLTVDLGSTTAANFDGTADASIGVSGELPIANGGTGASTQAGARSALGVPPTNHAVANTTYGSGTATNYGHVKLSDNYATIDANADSAHGVGASAWAMQTGLATKIGTVSTASPTASPIDLITWNEDIKRMVMRKRNADNTYINYNVPSIATSISDISSLITINNSNFTLIEGLFMLYGHVALLTIHGRFTSSVPHNSLIMSCNRPIYEPVGVIRCSSRDEANHVTTLDMRSGNKIYTWGQAQANPSALYIFNFMYIVGNVGGI